MKSIAAFRISPAGPATVQEPIVAMEGRSMGKVTLFLLAAGRHSSIMSPVRYDLTEKEEQETMKEIQSDYR